MVVLTLWWQISRSAKRLPHPPRRPSSFFFVLGYLVVLGVMAGIAIHQQGWLPRRVRVASGAVVPTGTPGYHTLTGQSVEQPVLAGASQ